MTINIQISDGNSNAPVSVNFDRNPPATSGAVSSSSGSSDGGTPQLSGAVSSSDVSAAGDVTDIGGPPSWLSEALGKANKSSEVSAAPAGDELGSGQDGGAAPSA